MQKLNTEDHANQYQNLQNLHNLQNLQNLLKFAKRLNIEVRLGVGTDFRVIPRVTRVVSSTRSTRIIKSKPVMTLQLTVDQLLTTHKSSQEHVIDELTHELGHFIAASKGRRRNIDFGIKATSKFADLEEFKARFVERELRQVFGVGSYIFLAAQKKQAIYKQAEEWWLSEGCFTVQTLLEFLT